VQFIKDHHPDVDRVLPPKPFFAKMMDKRFPPLRQQRWCCEHMKEWHGEGLILIGIRWAESIRRRARSMFEPCKKEPGKRFFLSPIIAWSDDDVWNFIIRENLPYCDLYDEVDDRGFYLFNRLGCVFCPMACGEQMQKAKVRWPKFHRSFISGFRRLMRWREENDMPITNFATAEQMFEWWLSRSRSKKDDKDEDQCEFRFDD